MRITRIAALVLLLALAVVAVSSAAPRACPQPPVGLTRLHPAYGTGDGGGGLLAPEWRRFFTNIRFFGWLSYFYPDSPSRMRPTLTGFASQAQAGLLPGGIGARSRLIR